MHRKRFVTYVFALLFAFSSSFALAQGRAKGGAKQIKAQEKSQKQDKKSHRKQDRDRDRDDFEARGRNGERIKHRGIDSNKDGKITRDEWRGNDVSFDRLDRNDDGILSGAELEPGVQGRKRGQNGHSDRTARRRFERIDRNNDGVISRDELDDDDLFERLDRNDDGVISRDEFSRR